MSAYLLPLLACCLVFLASAGKSRNKVSMKKVTALESIPVAVAPGQTVGDAAAAAMRNLPTRKALKGAKATAIPYETLSHEGSSIQEQVQASFSSSGAVSLGSFSEMDKRRFQVAATSSLESIGAVEAKSFASLIKDIHDLESEAKSAGEPVNFWKYTSTLLDSRLTHDYFAGYLLFANGEVFPKVEALLDIAAHNLRVVTDMVDEGCSEDQVHSQRALFMEFLRLFTFAKAFNREVMPSSYSDQVKEKVATEITAPLKKLRVMISIAASGKDVIWAGLRKQTENWPLEVTPLSQIREKGLQLVSPHAEPMEKSKIKEIMMTMARQNTQYAENDGVIDLVGAILRLVYTNSHVGLKEVARLALAIPNKEANHLIDVGPADNLYSFVIKVSENLPGIIRNFGMSRMRDARLEENATLLKVMARQLENLSMLSCRVSLQASQTIPVVKKLADEVTDDQMANLALPSIAQAAFQVRAQKKLQRVRAYLDRFKGKSTKGVEALFTHLDEYSVASDRNEELRNMAIEGEQMSECGSLLETYVKEKHLCAHQDQVDMLIDLLKAAFKVIKFTRGNLSSTDLHLHFLRTARMLAWNISNFIPACNGDIFALHELPSEDLSALTEIILESIPSHGEVFEPKQDFVRLMRRWILTLMVAPEVPESIFPGLLKIQEMLEQLRIPNNGALKALSPKVVDTLRTVAFEVQSLRLKEAISMLDRLLAQKEHPRLKQGVRKVLKLLETGEVLKLSQGIMEEQLAAAKRRVADALDSDVEPSRKNLSALRSILHSLLHKVDEKVLLGEHIDFDSAGFVRPQVRTMGKS